MRYIFRLNLFLKPYLMRAISALVLLTVLVALDLAIPRLIQRIIDQGIHRQDQQVVIWTGILMLGISFLSMGIAIGNNFLSVQVGEGVGRDLREAIFLKIQSFSFANLDEMQTGQILVRLSSDTSAVQRLVQVSLRIGTRAPLLMIGSLILMVRTSPSLAMIILPLLLFTLLIMVFFITRMEPLFRLVQRRMDRLNTILQENVAGARLIKAFVRADSEGKRFATANESFTDQSIKVSQIQAFMSPALTICVNIGMVIVIWAGGMDTIRGNLTVGQIVAFTNYLLTTMTPLIMMSRLSNVWASGMVSVKRVYEVLDTVPDIRDCPEALTVASDAPGKIIFKNVSFHYNDEQKKPVLRNINLTVKPGQMVALLGATGAGKSTLINLVPRFYEITGGSILLDDVDIRKLTQDSLLATIAVVPQQTILFSGTVDDNIRYGMPTATEEEVHAAAKAAQAHDFILRLPDGYATHVEARGVNLSGGQKQRIAIARALLTRSRILILDDATSSVDAETESRIQDGLHTLSPRRTLLVVAQRISTVLKADRIVVIDRGCIVAEGTHLELLQNSPIYQEIYDSQLGNGYSRVR